MVSATLVRTVTCPNRVEPAVPDEPPVSPQPSKDSAAASAGSPRARTVVVDAVGTGGGAPLLGRDDLAGGHPAGGDQEPGVTHHGVPGAYGEPLDVPLADQRLPRLGSVNPPCARTVSTNRLSWVVVAT